MNDLWRKSAACLDAPDVSIFFPAPGHLHDEAMAFCNTCPVRAECLEYAVPQVTLQGIWGGKSERQRQRLRQAQDGNTGSWGVGVHHGTSQGYRKHRREGEPACDECLTAWATYTGAQFRATRS